MQTTLNTRTLRYKFNNNDIIYAISTDNYDDLTIHVNENNVNNIIDNKNGYTALHYAVRMNNNKMIEFLLKMKANPYLKTSDKNDAFDLSLKYQSKHTFDCEINKLNEEIKDLTKDNTTLDKKVKDLTANINYMNKSLDDSMLKISLMKNQLTELKKDISNLRLENSSLLRDRNMNIQLQREISSLKNANLDLKNENDKVSKELNSLKRKYDTLQDSYGNILNRIRK